LNLRELCEGIYLCKMFENDEVIVKKIVISK
jgi:hypothetical protein